MKYFVRVKTLEWHDLGYIIEANSKEEAEELVEQSERDFEYDDYDCTDQFDVIDIEEYES